MKIKRALVLLLALALCACCAGPVFAADPAYAPIDGTSASFSKYLVMGSDASVPNAVFSFTIEAGAPADPTATTYGVMAGPTGTGAPSIADVSFAPANATTNGLPTDESGSVTEGKKYATQTVTVDLSGVQFSDPGIYRYLITETATTQQGITNDAETVRTLDVYIVDNNGVLEVAGCVLYEGEVTAAPAISTDPAQAIPAGAKKSTGFTNEYATQKLSIAKTVTGNQGSKNKYFKFTVTLSGAVPGTQYTVDLSLAEAAPAANAATSYTSMSNPELITVPADATTVSQVFYLRHDQAITIRGLAPDTVYAVTEESEDYTAAEGSAKVLTPASGTEGDPDYVPAKTYNDPVNGTIAAADVHTGYTNDRSGSVPMGVALTALPGIVIVCAAAIGLVLLGRKKKRN